MKTVNIGERKNQLSGYLQYVKNGEEIVIRDRSVPVARVLPFRHGSGWKPMLCNSPLRGYAFRRSARTCVFLSADAQLLEAARQPGLESVSA